MSLKRIRDKILEVVQTVVEVKTVIDKPKEKIAGEMPIVSVLYGGLTQAPAAVKSTANMYVWNVDLYLAAKNSDQAYEDMLDVVPGILAAFRKDPGLSGGAWFSIIPSGEPFTVEGISQPHIGHSFRIEVRTEEV